MLVTMDKKMHMVWHGSHASQITSWKTLVTQTIFDVSNEMDPILVKHFLGNELKDVYKKNFRQSVQRLCLMTNFA